MEKQAIKWQWEIKKIKTDCVRFFNLVNEYFFDCSSIFIEGSSISRQLLGYYESHCEHGDYVPCKQIRSSKTRTFRFSFSSDFFDHLAEIGDSYASVEIFDHIFLYKNEINMLEWCDAFHGPICLSHILDESRVKAFADELRGCYERV